MPKKSSPQQVRSQQVRAQQVRIIGGQWKRTLINVIDAPGLRPTPARVRETVFNWLDFLLQRDWQTLRCLDLFAGSGALGFEAASRGAAQVTMVESYLPAFQQLEKMRTKLETNQIELLRGDAQLMAQRLTDKGEQYDLIFLDPPFHHELLVDILPWCEKLLHPDGYLYLEAEQAFTSLDLLGQTENWKVIRADHAGQVFFHLLQRVRQ